MTPETLEEGQVGYCTNWRIEKRGDKHYIRKNEELHEGEGGTVVVEIRKQDGRLTAKGCTRPYVRLTPEEIATIRPKISIHLGPPLPTPEEEMKKFLEQNLEVELI